MLNAKQNVLITGIPRSGTSLAAALVDSLPDAACLSEPRWQFIWPMKNPSVSSEGFVQWLISDHRACRSQLLAGTPILDRRDSLGNAVTNYFGESSGDKPKEKQFELVPFVRAGLSADFILASKHNGPYIGVLKELVASQCFTIIAIIRHPVDVIASWQSVDVPVSRGQLPAAERFWPKMRELVQAKQGLLEKQVKLYDLICHRFDALRNSIHILKYEDLTTNPNLIGDMLDRDASAFASRITPRVRKEYPVIQEAVERYGQSYKRFYP